MKDYKQRLEQEIKEACEKKDSARKTTMSLFKMSETEKIFAPVDWDSMLCLYKTLVNANSLIHLYNEEFPDHKYDRDFDDEIRNLEQWFHNVFAKALNYPNGTSKNE